MGTSRPLGMARALIVLTLIATCAAQLFTNCNFNATDPKRDARCAEWLGLQPGAVQDPFFEKMLCFWPDPQIKNKDQWQSMLVGRADPTNLGAWTNTTNVTDLPVSIRQQLSSSAYNRGFLTCVGSETCC